VGDIRLRKTKDFLQATVGKKCSSFFKSYMTPLHLLIIVFPKSDLLTATGMALCVNHGPNRNIFMD
jgi:hypothetical protein